MFRSVLVLRGLRFFVCRNNAVSRVAASRLKLSFSAFIVVMWRFLEVFPEGKGGCFHGAKCQNLRVVIEYILLSSAQLIRRSIFKVFHVKTC